MESWAGGIRRVAPVVYDDPPLHKKFLGAPPLHPKLIEMTLPPKKKEKRKKEKREKGKRKNEK